MNTSNPNQNMNTNISIRKGTSSIRNLKVAAKLSNLCIHGLLIVGSILMLVPLLWMISNSLKDANEMYAFPPIWIPKDLLWENYVYMFKSAPWGIFLFNTSKITFF